MSITRTELMRMAAGGNVTQLAHDLLLEGADLLEAADKERGEHQWILLFT